MPTKKVSTTKKMSLLQKKNKLLLERYRTFYGLFAKSKKFNFHN